MADETENTETENTEIEETPDEITAEDVVEETTPEVEESYCHTACVTVTRSRATRRKTSA